MLDKQSKIYVAVHNGLEGSAILNILLHGEHNRHNKR